MYKYAHTYTYMQLKHLDMSLKLTQYFKSIKKKEFIDDTLLLSLEFFEVRCF